MPDPRSRCEPLHAFSGKCGSIVLLLRDGFHVVTSSNQQPLLLVLFQANQIPLAGKFFAMKNEMEFALGKVLCGRMALRLKRTVIPYHDCPAAVLSLGDDPFEVAI